VALAMAIGSGLAGWLKGRYSMREPSRAPVAVRFTISPPDNGSYRAGKISPDGRVLALVAVDANGKGQLWARRLDSVLAQPLTAAEYWPFWSPDSRFIAFVDAGKLKRIPANGGVAQTICDAALVVGGSWSRNGTILFSNGEALFVVSASGGVARPLTTLNIPRQETTHDFPIFLPDGTHFLYTIHSLRKENGGIYVGSIGSPNQRVRLLEDISNTEYIPGLATAPGYLLFVRAGVLMARRFAATDLLLKGEAFPVIDHVDQEPSNLSASFSGSENGTLLVTAPYGGDQVTWFDRTGKRLGTLGVPGLHLNPQLSPDERTVALDVTDPERFSSDIWLFPVSPGAPSRLTFNGSSRAVWSPMGERVVFGSSAAALYAKLPAGGETESLLLSAMGGSDDLRIPCEWSRDARFLIFSERNSKTGYDLWRLPLFGSVKPIRLLGGEYNEWCGTLSPDSKWIAYASDESGRSEIYVQAFSDEEPHSQRKWQLSDNGGYWPKWRRDGKEVLYLDPDRQVVAVAVKTGYGFEHGAAQRLFASGIRTVDARFDVTKNGQRFLIPTMATATHLQPARVVINWTAEIPR
jgi:Tol biopolymer transport system component